MVLSGGLVLMGIIMLGLQQHFWTQRRFVELRLDAIHDLNWLLAQLLTNYIADPAYAPDRQFLHSWNAAATKARSLFPDHATRLLKQADARICRPSEGMAGTSPPDVRELIELHEAALRALYREAGFRRLR